MSITHELYICQLHMNTSWSGGDNIDYRKTRFRKTRFIFITSQQYNYKIKKYNIISLILIEAAEPTSVNFKFDAPYPPVGIRLSARTEHKLWLDSEQATCIGRTNNARRLDDQHGHTARPNEQRTQPDWTVRAARLSKAPSRTPLKNPC